jgi:hypothetical protein
MTPDERARLIEAFTRGDDYLDSLSDVLYLTKVRVYEDTLGELADSYGYESEDVQIGDEVARALSDEADQQAERITDSYNRALAAFVERVADEVTYEDAVAQLVTWSDNRDDSHAEVIGITEAFTAHADATVTFFRDNDVEVQFDFGEHGTDDAPQCPVCIALVARNPHPLERVLRVGNPHIQCRQTWHALVDEGALPDEVELGLRGVAGIVGTDPLVNRTGGTQGAVQEVEALD